MYATMIPIDSHHAARLVPYVAVVVSTSPFFSFTRQSGLVPVIATSQDTAPAGSKYFAVDLNRCTLSPLPRGDLTRHFLAARARLEAPAVGRANLRAVALEPQVGVQAAGVQVAGGRDEHAVAVHDPRVPLATGRVGVRIVVRVGEHVLLARALVHVEHRIDACRSPRPSRSGAPA